MLSDHERRELALIEQGLREDQRLVASFRGRSARGRRRWPVRALIGLAILLVVTGLLAGTGALVIQGVLAGGIGVAWSRWQARGAAAEPPGGAPEPSTRRPGQTPPGRFQPS